MTRTPTTDHDTESPTIRGVGVHRREGRTVLLAPQDFHWSGPQVVLVTGPNGSGKSTMLRSIVGLSTPNEGTVTIDRTDPKARRVIKDVAFVPDAAVTFLDTSVDGQCRYVARLHGLKDVPPWTAGLADAVELGPSLRDRIPIAFSKGERQKASLLVHSSRPHRVLVLDEPSTGLDTDATAGLARWLREHAKTHGVLVVVASHDEVLIDAADQVHPLHRDRSEAPEA